MHLSGSVLYDEQNWCNRWFKRTKKIDNLLYTTFFPQNEEFEFLIEFFRLSVLDIIVEPVNSKAKFLSLTNCWWVQYIVNPKVLFLCMVRFCYHVFFVYFHCYERLTGSNHIISFYQFFFFIVKTLLLFVL